MDIFKYLQEWALSQGMSLSSKIVVAVILTGIGILVVRLVMEIISKALEKSKLEKAAHTLIRSLVRAILYLLLGLIVASSLGIDVTGIVALASVLTLAISLSVQNSLTNIIGGFTLLYTKPFCTGDFVEVAGQSGTVKEIGMTYTVLTTPDNKVISIPNSAVVSAQIVNYSTTGTRRLDINISASYDSPVETVLQALRETAVDPRVLQEPAAPFVALTSYGDSAINYTLRVWVNSADYWAVNFEFNEKIKKIFDEKGVIMTYPHMVVHLEK